MKKTFFKTLLLLVFFTICFSIGFSQEYKTTETGYSGTKMFIKFHDKKLYYLNRPIWVEFQIVNQGIHPYLFLAAYKKSFTFDFEVYTRTNRTVEHSREWVIDRHRFEAVLSDEIALKENEVYGVRIDISRWFDFPAPGEYIVRGVFYPDLITNPEKKYFSENELMLTLHPPYTEEVMQKERTEEIRQLKAQSLPPYEVVDVLLRALMDGDFEKYFLYLRFDRFIQQFENAYKKYRNAHDTEKPLVIDEFKQYITGGNKLEAIPYSEAVPVSFEIEETHIKGRDATVTAREKFRFLGLVEEKRYTYHLHLYGDKWLVEKYDVVNISK